MHSETVSIPTVQVPLLLWIHNKAQFLHLVGTVAMGIGLQVIFPTGALVGERGGCGGKWYDIKSGGQIGTIYRRVGRAE